MSLDSLSFAALSLNLMGPVLMGPVLMGLVLMGLDTLHLHPPPAALVCVRHGSGPPSSLSEARARAASRCRLAPPPSRRIRRPFPLRRPVARPRPIKASQ